MAFKQPVGYWVGLHGGGKPYYVRTDVELTWFADKVPKDRVIDLHLIVEDMQPLKFAIRDDFIPFPEAESQSHAYQISSDD